MYPLLDVAYLKSDVATDLVERNATLVHKPTHEPLADTKALGKSSGVDQALREWGDHALLRESRSGSVESSRSAVIVYLHCPTCRLPTLRRR